MIFRPERLFRWGSVLRSRYGRRERRQFIIPDTNILVHARPIKELPWREVAVAEVVVVLLIHPVLRELDRHKEDRNSRRARSARRIGPLLRELYNADEMKILIGSGTPAVFIQLATPMSGHLSRFGRRGRLAAESTDERIIEAALAVSIANPTDDVVILSNDIHLLVSCRHFGVKAMLPADTWMKPAESDELEKENIRLSKEIETLKTRAQGFDIKFATLGGEQISEVKFDVPRYEALTEERVRELTDLVINRYQPHKPDCPPEVLDPPVVIAGHPAFGGGAEAAMQRRGAENGSREALDERYRDEAREFFRHLPRELERPHRYRLVQIEIRNTGERAADRVTIDLKVDGTFLLRIPEPINPVVVPRPVGGRRAPSAMGRTLTIASGKRRSRSNSGTIRERFAVSFTDYPTGDQEAWALECEEFRYFEEPYRLRVLIGVAHSSEGRNGRLSCTVAAASPAARKFAELKLKVSFSGSDVEEAVADLVRSTPETNDLGKLTS